MIYNLWEKLNDDEWEEIKRHSEVGYRILSSVNEFAEIASSVLEHHERWDGKGYPKGLKGEAISLAARIIAKADSFDAMTRERTYKGVLTEEEAIIFVHQHYETRYILIATGTFPTPLGPQSAEHMIDNITVQVVGFFTCQIALWLFGFGFLQVYP